MTRTLRAHQAETDRIACEIASGAKIAGAIVDRR